MNTPEKLSELTADLREAASERFNDCYRSAEGGCTLAGCVKRGREYYAAQGVGDLPMWSDAQASRCDDFAAQELFRKAADAIDGLKRQVAEARFAPLGDNHHNALKCPHCNPESIDPAAERARAETAEAALKVAREALEPFARTIPDLPTEDERFYGWNTAAITYRECKAAHAAAKALSALQLPPEGEDESLGLVGISSPSATMPSADTSQLGCEPSGVAWQPIESGPRDGTWLRLLEGDVAYEGRWAAVSYQRDMGDLTVDRPGHVIYGWKQRSVAGERRPTHWAPRPASQTPCDTAPPVGEGEL